MKREFVKFLGHCALAGKQIAVYRNSDESYTLHAETVGGKPLRYTYKDRNGNTQHATVNDLTLSSDDFERFEERSSVGSISRGDASVVCRALIEMGYPA